MTRKNGSTKASSHKVAVTLSRVAAMVLANALQRDSGILHGELGDAEAKVFENIGDTISDVAHNAKIEGQTFGIVLNVKGQNQAAYLAELAEGAAGHLAGQTPPNEDNGDEDEDENGDGDSDMPIGNFLSLLSGGASFDEDMDWDGPDEIDWPTENDERTSTEALEAAE